MRLESYAPRNGQYIRSPFKQTQPARQPRIVGFQTQLNAGIGWLREKWQRMESSSAQTEQKPRVDLLDVLEDMEYALDSGTAVLGVTHFSEPITWQIHHEKQGHILIAGEANCGKTTLLRSLGLSLALLNRQSRLQLVGIDMRGEQALSLAPIEQLPHMLSPILRTVDDAMDMLDFLDEELAYRSHNQTTLPAIVVMIDGVVSLMEQGGTQVLNILQRLLTYGQEAGIHLAMCTRRPADALVGQLPIDLIPMRVVGSMSSATDATVAAGVVDSEAELLSEVGDFVVIAEQKITDFVGAALDAEGIWLCLDHLHQQREQRLLARAGMVYDDAVVDIQPTLVADEVTVLESAVSHPDVPPTPMIKPEPTALVVVEPTQPRDPIILPSPTIDEEEPVALEQALSRLEEEDDDVVMHDAEIGNPYEALARAVKAQEVEDAQELEYEDDPEFSDFAQFFKGASEEDDDIDEFPFL